MTLKSCPCCRIKQTTKNAIKIGRDQMGIYFNCRFCSSTFLLKKADWKYLPGVKK
jgi:hypothetical protein